jgi:dihydroorotate dehydrogenase
MALVDTGYRAVRPALFRLGGGDPEAAHEQTLRWLARAGSSPKSLAALRSLVRTDTSPRNVFGITFPSAVGLAAGLDKQGAALRAWPALGFGFTEVGTVTAVAQPGNERPRLFRLPESQALINRMGFNNGGAAAMAETLTRTGPLPTPLGISIGKSKVTPVGEAVEDYLTSLRLLAHHASYIAVNVSSPNTPDLRSLQDKEPLTELLGALVSEARVLSPQRPVPVLVKIAPDLSDTAMGEVLQVAADTGIAGVIATNTTTRREGLAVGDAGVAAEAGGLSGAPLRHRALEVVRFVASHADVPVIGVGGILEPADGLALLDAGASLLQLYTGFIYAGPGLVRALNRGILEREYGGISARQRSPRLRVRRMRQTGEQAR